MSAFTITKKLCGALELNKQPERRMKLVTTAVLLPVAGFMYYALCLIKGFVPKSTNDRGFCESGFGILGRPAV